MSYKSAEKKFYEKHYGESLGNFNSTIDHNKIRDNYFKFGSRYYLVDKVVQKISNRKILLEIGCGLGDTLRYMSETYGFNHSIGIDIAFKEKVAIEGKNFIEMMPANFNENLPFNDNSIDLLVAMMVIEHVFDPFHAFSDIHRLLSKDGVAVINLPLVTSLKNRIRIIFGQLPITSVPFKRWLTDREWDGNHLHYFNVDSIEQLCKVCNLKIIETSAVGKLTSLKNIFLSLLASELTFAVKRI